VELRRIGKKIEKRQSLKSSAQEEEYLRDLILNKKKDGDPMPGDAQSSTVGGISSAYSNIIQATHAWLFPSDGRQPPNMVRCPSIDVLPLHLIICMPPFINFLLRGRNE